ncbi:hypothetical protein K488DRAFT_85365 [Vararia minispora EC-137]|uniref:Uncharacterized protein n=1 Tax=Vararia minispora EC-137 TaxID=1314806 RepID=A0ACB8QMV0_9AGAM|nr:hypothetical protein K488DRAFT_85365 [Vararia minispora EC-137]
MQLPISAAIHAWKDVFELELEPVVDVRALVDGLVRAFVEGLVRALVEELVHRSSLAAVPTASESLHCAFGLEGDADGVGVVVTEAEEGDGVAQEAGIVAVEVEIGAEEDAARESDAERGRCCCGIPSELCPTEPATAPAAAAARGALKPGVRILPTPYEPMATPSSRAGTGPTLYDPALLGAGLTELAGAGGAR